MNCSCVKFASTILLTFGYTRNLNMPPKITTQNINSFKTGFARILHIFIFAVCLQALAYIYLLTRENSSPQNRKAITRIHVYIHALMFIFTDLLILNFGVVSFRCKILFRDRMSVLGPRTHTIKQEKTQSFREVSLLKFSLHTILQIFDHALNPFHLPNALRRSKVRPTLDFVCVLVTSPEQERFLAALRNET